MRAQRIEKEIRGFLTDLQNLEIIDESHQHAGRAGQESHFKVLVVSDDFMGKNRVQRQRSIHGLLKEEFDSGLHALSLRLLTNEEYAQQVSAFQSPQCSGSQDKS